MRLKYSFEAVDMGEEIIYVPVGKGANQINGVIKLNSEGSEILDMMKNDISENDIVSILDQKYENNRSNLAGYVHKVVEILRNAGLLQE